MSTMYTAAEVEEARQAGYEQGATEEAAEMRRYLTATMAGEVRTSGHDSGSLRHRLEQRIDDCGEVFLVDAVLELFAEFVEDWTE